MRSANWETGCPSHAWKRCPGENLSQLSFYRTFFVSPYFLSINNSLSLYIYISFMYVFIYSTFNRLWLLNSQGKQCYTAIMWFFLIFLFVLNLSISFLNPNLNPAVKRVWCLVFGLRFVAALQRLPRVHGVHEPRSSCAAGPEGRTAELRTPGDSGGGLSGWWNTVDMIPGYVMDMFICPSASLLSPSKTNPTLKAQTINRRNEFLCN
jgi:hypothetical protein